MHKSYLPRLKDELSKIVPNYNIELDYNPTKPNVKEVEEFGYKIVKTLRTTTFYDKAERIKHESWPRAAAFYSKLAIGSRGEMTTSSKGEMVILSNNEEEIDILYNKEE